MPVVKVLETSRAEYHRTTGLMVVEGSVESFLSTVASGSRPQDDRETIETLWHEWVHHMQALSCAQIRFEGLNTLQASGSVVLSQDAEVQRRSAMDLALLHRRFEHRAFGVSMRDLCEGAAILESFRIVYPELGVEDFMAWRDLAFPGKGNSPYRRTFSIMAHETSADVAFDLLPVVTFLALQGDVPGASFDALLTDERVRSGKLVGAAASDLVTTLGFGVLLDQFSRIDELHPSQRHPTLYPVLANLIGELGLDLALDLFARPHTIKPLLNDSRDIYETVFPPLLVGSFRLGSGAMVGYGVGSESGDLRRAILMLTAIVAAAKTIVSPQRQRVPCPHEVCPNHSSSACNGYFAPPDEPESCGFRNEIRGASGRELHELVTTAQSVLHKKDFKSMQSMTTADLFPEIMFEPGEEQASCAERFDSRYMLDPEDNDPIILRFCETTGCNTMLQIRASRRQTRAGFDVTCDNCGHTYRITEDSMPTFHYAPHKVV